MPSKPKPVISQHALRDWCHLCGRRKYPTADVWYANNAERDPPRAKLPKYVRICISCAMKITYAADPSGTVTP